MAHVLAVGIATLDIVSEVDQFPAEDDEVRALAQSFRRGGNATNTLVVLSQLGHRCDWAGAWVDDPVAAVLARDFDAFNIDTKYCQIFNQGKIPTSCITLNRSSASRTIIHYRDLPEYSYQCFEKIPLKDHDWLHFEARNILECRRMMMHAREHYPDLPISLEVEKLRDNTGELYTLADYIFFSPQVARAYASEPEAFLQAMSAQLPDTILTCTLGDQGAIGIGVDRKLERSSAYTPVELVETLGAGDTFNAAFIDAILDGKLLSAALDGACRLAGKKCGQQGFTGLAVV